MARTLVRLAAVLAFFTGTVRAEDLPQVQDPPGEVDVRQPADVALSERNSDQDTTDTLRGGSTEVIQGKTEADAEPDQAGVRWREVEAGEEARASFQTPAADADAEAATEASTTSQEVMPGTTYSEDTWLGTDLGYGVGTAPVETPVPVR